MEEDASPLRDFIAASKSRGASDESLVALLTRRGWPPEEIYSALGDYWASLTGLAVPGRAASGESSRDAFLFLLAFSTLCCWATALGSAIFSFINRWLPDPVDYRLAGSGWERSSITWQMSTLAVAFPIYVLVMRTIVKESWMSSAPAQSGVRKWLTYLALLLTAGTMIGDLIWFLHSLLAGEISSRFVLKSLTVIVICGAIFTYYLPSLRHWRKDVVSSRHWHRLFAAASALAVLAVFVLGVSVAGTPHVQREYQADQTRVSALRRIASAIRLLARMKVAGSSPLPTSLSELVQNGRVKAAEVEDPESKQPYEYRVLDGDRYELCARFSHPGENNGVVYANSSFWQHGAGRACFVINPASPDVF